MSNPLNSTAPLDFESEQPEQIRKTVSVSIDAAKITNYAAIQNQVPLIHRIQIENHTSDDLLDVELLIGANPDFLEGVKLPIERVLAGQTYSLAPAQLKNLGPNHSYLHDLNEAEKGQITVKCTARNIEPVSCLHDIELLAKTEWGAFRGLPELLAAHVQPNETDIDKILSQASQLLRATDPLLSLDGYQSKNRERVWKQINAIYKVLCNQGLQYALPPASFERTGQKIRTTSQILEGKVATCLDTTILMAACFEQAGLNPVVLIKEGHAWAGVWLVDSNFSLPLVESAQDVRKRVEAGELLMLESTDLTAGRMANMTHSKASADRYVDEAQTTFQYAIDIRRAREAHIRPMKSVRIAKGPSDIEAQNTSPTEPSGLELEEMPSLPPIDPASLNPTEALAPSTPQGRLNHWKSKLLDLTLRNKLLNFKPGKRFLPLITHSPAALEDALASDREFRLTAKPGLMQESDPRSEELFRQEHGISSAQAHARQVLAGNELVFDCPSNEFLNLSTAIYREGKTALEETGSNSLYISIGMLHWKETAESETVLKAPLLLVPVSLKRAGAGAGIRLQRLDEDTIFNPTLLQKLLIQFELSLPYSDGRLPTDDNGIHVDAVLQTVRQKVLELPGFEVRPDCYLGNFSFTKYVMWKDLESNSDALQQSTVVRHLINRKGEAFVEEAQSVSSKDIDTLYKPSELFTPLLCDSSQLAVICTAERGKNMVVKGPPGTGKSQTITNLIAHCLAKGKSVLFVAEKMAALEVVHKRLKDIGLADFCLELHSSKAKKSEIAKQISESLSSTLAHSPQEWEREAEKLASLRNELNSLVRVLHHKHRNGLTVFSAMGETLKTPDRQPAALSWQDADQHDYKELADLTDFVGQLAALATQLSAMANHPLSEIGCKSWTPSWESELLSKLTQCNQQAYALTQACQGLAELAPLNPETASFAQFEAHATLCALLMKACQVPTSAIEHSLSTSARQDLQSLISCGQARDAAWDHFDSNYLPELATVTASPLKIQWIAATQDWWPKSWFSKRRVTSQLKIFHRQGKRLVDEEVLKFLQNLETLNSQDQFLTQNGAKGVQLLGSEFKGPQTNWVKAQADLHWMDEFNKASALAFEAAKAQSDELRTTLRTKLCNLNASFEPDGFLFKQALRYREEFALFQTRFAELTTLAQPRTEFAGGPQAPALLPNLRAIQAGVQSHRIELQPWCNWNKGRAEALSKGLASLIDQVEQGVVTLAQLQPQFTFSYANWWLRKIMDKEPMLSGFSGAAHNFKIDEFKKTDTKFQQLTAAYIQAVLKGNIPVENELVGSLGAEAAFLKREAQKQRQHKSIRELIKTSNNVIRRVKPCMLMSPQSVAQYLEAGSQLFDIVIFDEASQIPTWDAVGAIARGKQLICVGDPKQLPPTNFFNSSDSEGMLDEDSVQEMESILDECLGSGLPETQLEWHYRSQNESLITFSNYQYYDNTLVTFPSPNVKDTAVEFVDAKGVYEPGKSRTNKLEAQLIVEEIARHYKSPEGSKLSLGVITFNATQQALIEKLLDEKCVADRALNEAISQSSVEDLFIKNLENVQGDERDIILFSITFGRDAAGKLSMNFGPMNKDGGHRRLNVAATRARVKVKVFSSMRPEDIDLSRTNAQGVRDLKAYLDFALNGTKALASQSIPTGREPDSPFEVAVITALRDRGWEVTPQVGVSGYRIDLAVHSRKNAGKFLLGVECDGATYHSAPSARDRDRLRQIILEGLGWKIHRIWSTDWWFNAPQQINSLVAKLEELEKLETPEIESQPV